jgi:hypothetical protein
MRIAPTLREMHREPPLRWSEEDRKKARAELRAMLRVINALKRERKYDMPPWPNHKRTDKALAALEKLSGGGR